MTGIQLVAIRLGGWSMQRRIARLPRALDSPSIQPSLRTGSFFMDT